MTIQLIQGDCLGVMKGMEAGRVDAIITDLPYGTTACKWDSVIPFEPMWEAVKHVLKPSGVFITTASQPFTSALVMSNIKWFKYEWVWDKIIGVGFQTAKYRPMMRHENILVFCNGTLIYYPIKTERVKPITGYATKSEHYPKANFDKKQRTYTDKYPTSIIEFKKIKNTIHPTQKPVALFEYLIKTYTNEGETVLDMTMGSGTTGVACVNTGRNFIGIERDPEYFKIAERRIAEAQLQERMPI